MKPLDDQAISDALLSGAGAPAGACPDPLRFWEAATGDLPAAEARALLDHAASCAACSLALRAAREVRAVSGVPERESPESSAPPSPWERLKGTVLGPRPALAYLLLLALGGPLAWWARGTLEVAPRPAPMVPPAAAPALVPPPELVLPRVLQLTGDPALRGEGAPPDAPAVGGGSVLLRMYVDPRDVPAGAPLRVRLSSGSLAAVELPVAADLEAMGTLDVLLDASQLQPGRVYTVEVVAGERTVFRQSLRR